MPRKLKIPCPTKSEVNKYRKIWNKTENLYKPEEALRKLFGGYPKNTDIRDILIKIYALNDAFSTHVFWSITVAKNIRNLGIDADLSRGDISVIDKIAKKNGKRKFKFNKKDKNGEIIKGEKIKKEFYSFATKYANFHQPDKFPLFDSNVERALKYFKRYCPRFTFNDTNLRMYKAFTDIIREFQKVFGLQNVPFKDLDKYLYLVGRKLIKRKPVRK